MNGFYRGGVSTLFGFPVLGVLLCCLVGCATVSPVTDPDDFSCAPFWQAMDGAIADEQVGDGYGAQLVGFDYLRVDRFIAALAEQADSTRKERALVEQMRQLDLQRRYLALEFLSDEAWADLSRQGYSSDEGVFKRLVASCSADLMQADRQDGHYFTKVMAAIDVDQDYSSLYRILGLYPLTQLVVNHQVQKYQEEHGIALNVAMAGESRLIGPPVGRKLSPKRLQRLLRNSRTKPFLDLQLTQQYILDLVHYYGPVFELGGRSFGRITAGDHGDWQVDETEPVVYYYLSRALVQGIPALQINYVVWFADRREPAPWYTQGHLDGITLRLTLDWQGRPLVFDSIGNCGCFYFALHNDEVADLDLPAGAQPHFVGTLPPLGPEQHLTVQVEAGSNSVVGVSAQELAEQNPTYTLMDYASLERYSPHLPHKFFTDKGFVPDTQRFERYLLFPMGIPGVGAMRQRGRQPITLIGRAYFDDPHLFDTVLTVKEPLPSPKKLVKKSKKRGSTLQRRVESGKAMGASGVSRKDKYLRSRGLER